MSSLEVSDLALGIIVLAGEFVGTPLTGRQKLGAQVFGLDPVGQVFGDPLGDEGVNLISLDDGQLAAVVVSATVAHVSGISRLTFPLTDGRRNQTATTDTASKKTGGDMRVSRRTTNTVPRCSGTLRPAVHLLADQRGR